MANRYCKSIQFGINGPVYIIKDEELDNQLTEHIEDFATLNVQFNALKSTVAGYSSQINALQSNVTTLSSNVNALQTKVNQNTSNIGTIETALNNQGEAILSMANAISSIQSSLSSLQSSITSIRRDMSYMTARIEKVEEAIHIDPPEPSVDPEYDYDSVTGNLNFTNITVISDIDGNIILDSDNNLY